jgi:hypothetical protein
MWPKKQRFWLHAIVLLQPRQHFFRQEKAAFQYAQRT